MNRYTYTTKISWDLITKDGIEQDYRKFVSEGEAIRFRDQVMEYNPQVRNCKMTPIN